MRSLTAVALWIALCLSSSAAHWDVGGLDTLAFRHAASHPAALARSTVKREPGPHHPQIVALPTATTPVLDRRVLAHAPRADERYDSSSRDLSFPYDATAPPAP